MGRAEAGRKIPSACICHRQQHCHPAQEPTTERSIPWLLRVDIHYERQGKCFRYGFVACSGYQHVCFIGSWGYILANILGTYVWRLGVFCYEIQGPLYYKGPQELGLDVVR
jgi:hypothetical protein